MPAGGYDIVFAKVRPTRWARARRSNRSARYEGAPAKFELNGNEFNNRIVGNDGSNSFNGGGGADVFYGNGGNDYYSVDSADDLVIETAGDGYDIVFVTGAGYTLSTGSEVESIGAYNQSATTEMSLFGNEFDNRMVGNNGSNSSTAAPAPTSCTAGRQRLLYRGQCRRPGDRDGRARAMTSSSPTPPTRSGGPGDRIAGRLQSRGAPPRSS